MGKKCKAMEKKAALPVNNELSQMLFSDSHPSEEEKNELIGSNLGVISTYVNEISELNDTIAGIEKDLKEKKERLKAISELLIPELFDTIQVEEITLSDGSKVSVKTKYAAGITEKSKPECLKWLRDNKFDGIISNEIVTKLKKGEGKHAKEIMAFLTKKKLIVKNKEFVHPQTLCAFVKERIDQEAQTKEEFPRELFSVFTIKQTKVTKK